MLLRAPSKINLSLKILNKREDGYHEISGVMRAVRLFDEVDCVVKRRSNPAITVKTNAPGVPDGAENLAYKAAELTIAKLAPDLPVRIDINIKKNIPAAAGLAGGSSDAAAAILAIAKELSPTTNISELAAIGAVIGADIPFCLYACAEANPFLGYTGMNSALTEGVGDILTPLADPGNAKVLLVRPDIEIRAADIYARYDEMQPVAGRPESDNDLEGPCISMYPVVGEIISVLKDLCLKENAGTAKVQMSGSGPTVFIWFDEEAFGSDTEQAAARIYEKAVIAFPGSFVCLTDSL